MRTEPLISIVLPTHNGCLHILESIKSCQDQQYTKWELIVVDDASTDNTPHILHQLSSSDPRIQIIRHDLKRNLPAALNTGFAHTKGEFLTWTSDDNYYRPNALKAMLLLLQDHPDIDVVYTDFTVVDELGRFLKFEMVRSSEDLLKGNCVGPSFLFRREVMETIGPYAEDLILAEDYDFWLRVSTRFCMFPLHQDLYCYRIHPNSLTSLSIDRRHRVTEKALARNLPSMKWVARPTKSESYAILARHALTHRDGAATLSYLTKAFCFSPIFFARHYLKAAGRRCRNLLKRTTLLGSR